MRKQKRRSKIAVSFVFLFMFLHILHSYSNPSLYLLLFVKLDSSKYFLQTEHFFMVIPRQNPASNPLTLPRDTDAKSDGLDAGNCKGKFALIGISWQSLVYHKTQSRGMGLFATYRRQNIGDCVIVWIDKCHNSHY